MPKSTPPKPSIDQQVVDYINENWNRPITKLFHTNPYLNEPACKAWLALYALTYQSPKLNTERLLLEWADLYRLKSNARDTYSRILFLEELVYKYMKDQHLDYEIITKDGTSYIQIKQLTP